MARLRELDASGDNPHEVTLKPEDRDNLKSINRRDARGPSKSLEATDQRE